MRISDFDLYRELLKKESGLILTPDKSYILDSRLTPVARKWGYISLESMTMALRAVPDPELVNDVVESMTNHDSLFFRNKNQFHILEETVLPYLQKNRKKKHHLEIWSTACSIGQEPYSIAMLLKEHQEELKHWSTEILSTDISLKALKRANAGVYSQFEVQRGLPIRLLVEHFDKHNDNWQIKEDIRAMVHFEYFNLLDKTSHLGTFDIIFCCNVLSCFDKETRKRVLDEISKCLTNDGFLFLDEKNIDLNITDSIKPLEGFDGLYVREDGKLKNFKPLLKQAFA